MIKLNACLNIKGNNSDLYDKIYKVIYSNRIHLRLLLSIKGGALSEGHRHHCLQTDNA